MAKLHAGMVSSGSCFLAMQQYAGRGQRGKQWVAEPGLNITMSTVFVHPQAVSSNIGAFPFVLSASAALSCYDFIKDFIEEGVSIKWPNDVYVGDRKAAGILIENVYRGSSCSASIVGIGVNVNQQSFSVEGAKPVSLAMLTGTSHNVISLGKQLHQILCTRTAQLLALPPSKILEEYNSRLYRRNEEVKIRRQNIISSVIIKEVLQNGELVTSGPVEQRFVSGEIEFIV